MNIGAEIRSAINRLKIRVSENPITAAADIRHRAAWAFPRTPRPASDPLWERLTAGEGLHSATTWQRIAEFQSSAEVIMFFDENDEKCGFTFSSLNEVVRVLADSFGFVFYLADPDLHYLLAFNDHDVLIGWGIAAPWVSTLRLQYNCADA